MAEVNPKAYPLADAQLTITILDIVQQAAVRAIQSPFLGFSARRTAFPAFQDCVCIRSTSHSPSALDGRLPRDLDASVARALTIHLTSFFSFLILRDRYTTNRTTSN
jgi:hypothetical protein